MRIKFFLIFVILIFIFLSSCAIEPISYDTEIHVRMLDHVFEPNTWHVPAGHEIILTISNADSKPHDWTLIGGPIDRPFSEHDRQKVIFQVILEPREVKSVTFLSPLGPGEYLVISTLDENLNKNISGKLIIIQK